MEKTFSKKVNLSAVIFIIFVLILLVLGIWFYSNTFIDTTIANSNVAINNINTNIFINNPTKTPFKLGDYYVRSSETTLDDEINSTDYRISFLEDNTFTAYISWGNNISGTYNISDDNIINCTVYNFWSEYSPNQDTYAEISFKINSVTEIEVTDASEYYTIKTTNLSENGNSWILTDEDKDMTLGIKNGLKFILFN